MHHAEHWLCLAVSVECSVALPRLPAPHHHTAEFLSDLQGFTQGDPHRLQERPQAFQVPGHPSPCLACPLRLQVCTASCFSSAEPGLAVTAPCSEPSRTCYGRPAMLPAMLPARLQLPGSVQASALIWVPEQASWVQYPP